MIAPGKRFGAVPTSYATLSFTFAVRAFLKDRYVNTGIGRGLIPLDRGLRDNSRMRVLASGAREIRGS